jgi:hypothetical protein
MQHLNPTPAHLALPLALLPLCLLPLGACTASGPQADARIHPQRPFISQDTQTTADKVIAAELGYAVVQGHEAETPLTLRYGLGPQTEFYTTTSPYKDVNYSGLQPDGSGWGDTFVGFRHRLRDKDMFSPGYGFQVQTKLPTGRPSKGLGSGDIDWFAAAMANQIYYGFDTTLFYQVGLIGETGQNAGNTNHEHTVALQTRREMASNILAFAEAALIWEPEIDREESTLMGGVSFLLDPLTAVDLGVRVGLTDDAPSFQVLFGISRALGMLFFPEDDMRASMRR